MSIEHLLDAINASEEEGDAWLDDYALQASAQIFDLRKEALMGARHDELAAKGAPSAAAVIARAKLYYEFLTNGADNSPNAEKPRRADAHPPSPDDVEKNIKSALRAAGFNVL